MDSQVKSIFEQLVKRLDQIQNQQSQMTVRLDTVQNILECQTQKQDSLDVKLSQMTSRLDGEKTFFTGQLRESHHEILAQLRDIQAHDGGGLPVTPSGVSDSGHALHHLTKPVKEWRDVVVDFKVKLDILDQKTHLMRAQITETTQICQNLSKTTRQKEAQLQDSIAEIGDQQRALLQASLSEITDVVRGQTRAELVWLETNIGDKLSEIDEAVNLKYELIRTDINEQSNQSRQVIETLLKQQGQITETLDTQQGQELRESVEELKHYIDIVKQDIFAVTEKEAQIVRDRIEGPLPSLGKYTFDLFVGKFKTLVRSGKVIVSLPWHINEMRSCVKGGVAFNLDGRMKVMILYGRHPREVGLPTRSRVLIKVKATICDINMKILPPLDINDNTTSTMDESIISTNSGWGSELGMIACDDLIQKGYGEKEMYGNEAVLIRFDVTVLK